MSALTERVDAVADRPPLCELAPADRAELEREVARARELEDLPGRWQAAVLAAESGTEPQGCCH